ncbi:MAG TPA: Ni/Fe hydrogenase, partial [Bacillota bacterium]|nr:Ni/Fe hydrogenase [Bacillota bacterium]
MSKESVTCPEYKARLNTAAVLVDAVKTKIRQGVLGKRNLVWLELTGCSGNIISLLDGSNPDFKYLISQMTHFIYSN